MGSEELQAPIPGKCASPATSTPWGLGYLSSPLPSSPGLPAAATQGSDRSGCHGDPESHVTLRTRSTAQPCNSQRPAAERKEHGRGDVSRPCPRRTVVAWSQEGPRLWSREGAGPHPNPVLPEGTN